MSKRKSEEGEDATAQLKVLRTSVSTDVKREKEENEEPDVIEEEDNIPPFLFQIDHVRLYYSQCLPVDALIKWLGGDIKHREFSLTLHSDVAPLRYKEYANGDELRRALSKSYGSSNEFVTKFDIGGVFGSSMDLKDHAQPIERELVIDIDLNDFDVVRRFICDCTKFKRPSASAESIAAASKSKLCDKCWMLINAAARIVDYTLRDAFGFTQLTWVFSGRRGLHCWVSDPSARKLSNEARTAIIKNMTLPLDKKTQCPCIPFSMSDGDDEKKKKPAIEGLLLTHHMHEGFTTILEPAFRECVVKRTDFLMTEAGGEWILGPITESKASDSQKLNNIRSRLREELQWRSSDRTSEERWDRFKSNCESAIVKYGPYTPNGIRVKRYLYTPVFEFFYPRLDERVTKTINHLLKAPFSVHPSTGLISVPVDITKIDSFEPWAVPSITDVIVAFENKPSRNILLPYCLLLSHKPSLTWYTLSLFLPIPCVSLDGFQNETQVPLRRHCDVVGETLSGHCQLR